MMNLILHCQEVSLLSQTLLQEGWDLYGIAKNGSRQKFSRARDLLCQFLLDSAMDYRVKKVNQLQYYSGIWLANVNSLESIPTNLIPS